MMTSIDLKQATSQAKSAIRLFYHGDYVLNEMDQDDVKYSFGFIKEGDDGDSDLFVEINKSTGLVGYIGVKY